MFATAAIARSDAKDKNFYKLAYLNSLVECLLRVILDFMKGNTSQDLCLYFSAGYF
jgi:hypothetical protein